MSSGSLSTARLSNSIGMAPRTDLSNCMLRPPFPAVGFVSGLSRIASGRSTVAPSQSDAVDWLGKRSEKRREVRGAGTVEINGCRCMKRDGISSVSSAMGRIYCWKGTRCRAVANRGHGGCRNCSGTGAPLELAPNPYNIQDDDRHRLLKAVVDFGLVTQLHQVASLAQRTSDRTGASSTSCRRAFRLALVESSRIAQIRNTDAIRFEEDGQSGRSIAPGQTNRKRYLLRSGMTDIVSALAGRGSTIVSSWLIPTITLD